MLLKILREGLRSVWEPPRSQIGALDGMRAFAILFVVWTHVGLTFEELKMPDTLMGRMPFVRGGWTGVDMFFVLSGFFIGSQLWKEYQGAGTVKVGRFLMRRGLRIWPLFYTVFFVFLAARLYSGRPFQNLWAEFLLLCNYFPGGVVGGSWSLATEEQFYIAVPLMIVAAAAVFKPSLRALRYGVLGLMALVPLGRWLTWQQMDGNTDLIMNKLYLPFHTHCDGLLMGLVISNLVVARAKIPVLFAKHSWVVLPMAGVAAVALRLMHPIVFGYLSIALLFGALAWVCIQGGPRNWIVRFMSWRGFYIIARLSFGMYLLHGIVLRPLCEWLMRALPGVDPNIVFGLGLIVVPIAAMLPALIGYVLIEQPFLSMRTRMRWLDMPGHDNKHKA